MFTNNLYTCFYEDIEYELLDDKYSYQKYSELEQKQILIKKGIYVQFHTPFVGKDPYQVIHDFGYIPTFKFEFGEFFVLEHQIFDLNPKLLSNICDEIEKVSKALLNLKIDTITQELEYELLLYLPGEHIEIYKKKRKKILDDFELFKNNSLLEFDLINSNSGANAYLLMNKEDIEDYLFDKDIFKLTAFVEYSKSYIFYNSILHYNNLIKNKTANSLNSITSRNFRYDIFVDKKSNLLFDYIVENWQKKKNTSFYSMLYKYLQDKNKIILIDNDSVLYRNFIMNTYNLSSFSRIQNKSSNKEQTVWNSTFKTFDKLTEIFFTQQSE